MRILDWLSKALGFNEPNIEEFLVSTGEAAPDLKPSADLLLEKLRASVDPTNVAEAVAALPEEMKNIIRLKLFPEDHPSDAI